MKQSIPIDLDYLVFAWQDDSPETAYYLDCETGSVILVQRDLDDVDELREEIELQPNRFLYVPKPDARWREGNLSDFVFTVPDSRLRGLLELGLARPNQVEPCLRILLQNAQEFQRWQQWQTQAAREGVRKWLAAHDIEVQG